MTLSNDQNLPAIYSQLLEKCKEIGFTMPSDIHIGALLKTLITSKPSGNFLELGTGIGLSLSWMVEGLEENSTLITIDNDEGLISIAREFYGQNEQLTILCEDGGLWLKEYRGQKFDLIFADAWPGKYQDLDEALALVKPGGFYVIDDMAPQSNWPDGHQQKAESLIRTLEKRNDLVLTKMHWSTGVIVGTKVSS